MSATDAATAPLLNRLQDAGWSIVHHRVLPGREPRFACLADLALSEEAKTYIDRNLSAGLYSHQAVALRAFESGEDVGVATATSSGKTAVFHLAYLQERSRHPEGTALCLYPMLALVSEQMDRWKAALETAESSAKVGRIDGSVSTMDRPSIISQSGVVAATPDTVHSWLLPNSQKPAVRRFLQNLRIIVIDEVHTFSGVFGSHTALLLRRLLHVCGLLGSTPRIVAASATIANPEEHLARLTGRKVSIVGEEENGGRLMQRDVLMVKPPENLEPLDATIRFLTETAETGTEPFIAFVDSRKQVEHIAGRTARVSAHATAVLSEDMTEEWLERRHDHLDHLNILPYRSGLEREDRARIQDRLARGELMGVVSTSALELGIDVKGLKLAVLYGVPSSSTSFYQRIGRVGRHEPGTILVVNRLTASDEFVFRDPDRLFSRPPKESALYTDNKRIQYIHAMCLARLGGEHDAISGASAEAAFESDVDWPHGFLDLVQAERTGQIPGELQAMKGDAGDVPHHVFPLRDVEAQFQVEERRQGETERRGTLSYSQVMREAYPGAVYLYTTRAYRVTKVEVRSRKIQVREEKKYSTKPRCLPTLVYPNLTPGNVHAQVGLGTVEAIEANLQVQERVVGYTERRGPTEETITYPLDSRVGLFFDRTLFSRTVFTSGVVLFHPALNAAGCQHQDLAELLLEALLTVAPFERSDLDASSDNLRQAYGDHKVGERFLAVFDSTYGSLRLTHRLVEVDILRTALGTLAELAEESPLSAETIAAAHAIAAQASEAYRNVSVSGDGRADPIEQRDWIPVIVGGQAFVRTEPPEIVEIIEVELDPKDGHLYYRYRRPGDGPTTTRTIVKDQVAEVQGVSKMGRFYPLRREVEAEYDV